MKTIIVLAMSLFSFVLNAQTKEETIQSALNDWNKGKSKHAIETLNKVSVKDSKDWLPIYYVALIQVSDAFNSTNKEQIQSLIVESQISIARASEISPSNAEIIVLQALNNTLILMQNPMQNGMKYSMIINDLYKKAYELEPNNPRVIFSKAEFDFIGSQWTGIDLKPVCKQIEKSLELFATFKLQSPIHPNWGKERAEKLLKQCK
jgi:hypothetical protein